MLKTIVCPVSFTKTDSNRSRLTSLFAVALLAAYLASGVALFAYVAAVDYGLRALGLGTFSPLRALAQGIADALQIAPRPIDEAPKLFAARVGFLCALTASLLHLAGLPAGGLAVAAMLAVFSLLDAAANLCVGCVMYTYLVFPWLGARQ